MLSVSCFTVFFFFFKQKTAYEMRISDWSSDVCSSDLQIAYSLSKSALWQATATLAVAFGSRARVNAVAPGLTMATDDYSAAQVERLAKRMPLGALPTPVQRSEEHTSELQSLMRISYAVFCLKKKTKNTNMKSKATE